MGRLIDTDAITDFMLEHNIPDSLFASVEEIVAYQPTAFDIEAVVKELEELIRIEELEECPMESCTTCGCGDDCKGCYTRRAIEVVRKGGVQ